MAAIGALPMDALEGYCVIGELALDGAQVRLRSGGHGEIARPRKRRNRNN